MIAIDYKSRLPIYEQVVEGVKQAVLRGLLTAEGQLPSVRQLSGELGVNPNTVQRAYALLELQGVIYTIPGKGNFVSADVEVLRSEKREDALGRLRGCAGELKQMGVTEEQSVDAVRQTYREGEQR